MHFKDLFNTVFLGETNNELTRKFARKLLSSDMPFYWTCCDTRRALLASTVPASIGLAQIWSSRPGKSYHEFLKNSLTPKWFSDCSKFHGIAELATLSPLGYASYIIYKYGGGFDYTDTTIALGLYGTNLVLAAVPFCLFPKRDYKKLTITKVLACVTAAATLIAFRQIDEKAGWYVLPYALWTAFWSYASYQMMRANSSVNA